MHVQDTTGAVRKGQPRRLIKRQQGRVQLDFQVNDETYFLSLAENERQWLVMVETPTGTRSIPVYVDAPDFEEEAKIVVEDKDRRKIVN